ncbi:MAG: hypothetical protein HY301_16625, partial [Verrucomicrobia bacterium]|nr:hypothetical protein [Verrucomicrobiota bacterium]
GLPGTKAKYTLYGRNLPGGAPAKDVTVDGKPLEQLIVEIELPGDALAKQRLQSSALVRPGAAALDGIEYRLKSPHGVSNPARVGFATAPVIAEPLDAPPKSQKLTPPCEFAGQFRRRGEPTVLTFDAKKGDVWWLEVFSQRLGTPTDPSVLIERVTKNDKGEESATTIAELADSDANLGGPEFNTASRDPSYRFEAKEDGLHRISVRDLFNRNPTDARHPFRLALRKESPDFRLVALAPQETRADKNQRIVSPTAPSLRRGETQVVKVLALRRDGFNGEIQLAAEGLPAGVKSAGAKIPEGKNSALLAITAKADATAWSGVLKIAGKAKAGDTELVREARGGAATWHVADSNNDAIESRLTRDLALGVSGTETAPITIEPTAAKTFEAVAGNLKIPLKLTRHGEFNENLKLKAVGVPALDSLGELEVNAKTNAATLEIDLSKTKLPAGTHSFILQAQTKGKFRSYEAESKSADEAAKLAEKDAKAAAESAKNASDALAAAKKADEEAAKQVKSASETDKESLAAKAKSAADAKTAAEKTATEATAKSKAADEKKTSAQEAAKKFAEKSKAKEATIMVYSAPITVVVKAEEKKPEEKK